MKWTAFVAALLLASTALAQTPAPAPETAPPAAAPAPAPAAPAATPAPAPVAAAPAAKPAAPAFTFALKGFVSMSAAYQTGQFFPSEGQQSLSSATGAGTVPDKNSLTFDVRQSRFNFSVQGPKIVRLGATPTGVMEIDFMQGFGGGNFGNVSLLNRLRLAYGELSWGNHRLQMGQQNDLVFAMAPTSLSHIAFPLGYFTGNVGWRRPGIFGFHQFPLSSDLKLEAAWEVGRSQWADAATGAGGGTVNTPSGISLGEASGAPALEGRVTVSWSKYVNAFVATHWQQIDANGYGAGGALGTSSKSTVKTTAFNGGVKLTLPVAGDMALSLAATGFTGVNVAPLIANLSTAANAFKFGPNGEDVDTTGYWAQAGFNLTKELSFWAFYGAQAIDKKDFATANFGTGAPYENETTNLIAMYRDQGFAVSAEWIHFDTKYATAGGTPTAPITASRTAKSDQYMLTANYFF